MKERLEEWSGSKKLVFVKFFFWKPGSDLQTKFKGLAHGLLYSLMSASPDLIPMVFPTQWVETSASWTIHFGSHEEIEHTFTHLISLDRAFLEHRFVLFIDGLDEFEGNHAEMLKLLFDWTSCRPDDLKICASSREWSVFQDAFHGLPKLRLQDVIRADMTVLVRDRLASNTTFSALGSDNSRSSFQDQVVDKAEGVFLWVALVLRDVEEGLLSGDTLTQLVAKVNSLPGELEDLFQYLFDSIHRTDQKEIYTILAIAIRRHSRNWLLFRIGLVEDYLRDLGFAMRW
jgi:hypothetical protein